MYFEFERRTRLAELEAKYYHPRELEPIRVRVRIPHILEYAVMALRAALARRAARSQQVPVALSRSAGAAK
jgi:hypothetical protein